MKVKGFQDTIEWYNQNAQHYADVSISARSIHDREQFERFSSMLPEHGKILDAGCGTGNDAHLFAERGFEVTGVDLSQGLIEQARKRFPETTFVEGDLLKLPFEDEFFDGIWAHASLLHFEQVEEVEQALHQFQCVLKKNGSLYVLVKAQKGNAKTAVVKDSLSGHDRFFQYFKIKELHALLENQGFEVKEIKQFKEIDRNPAGRPEVEWIFSLSRKQ